jgi:hypothetical protein
MNRKILISILFSLTGIFLSCHVKYQLTADAQHIYDSLVQPYYLNRIEILEGTPYQTPAFIFDSGKQGTAILILGGTHGDEPAGYETSLRILEILQSRPPKQGKVIIIPLANHLAVKTYKRRVPVPAGVDKEKGNLNRCYPGKQNGYPMEQMANHIQHLAVKHQVEIFIDLHEARYLHLNTPAESEREKGLGQTIIYYPNEGSSSLLIDLLDKINGTISNSDEKFSSLEQPILNSAAWWAGSELDIAAYTFETSRSLTLAKRIEYHLQLLTIVFEYSGIW